LFNLKKQFIDLEGKRSSSRRKLENNDQNSILLIYIEVG